MGVGVGVEVVLPVGPGVEVASVGWLVEVGVEGVGVTKGVPVGVAVKVGKGVAVLTGREVETSETRPKLARRQACKKARKPRKPAPRIKCLLSILFVK